MKKDKIEYNQIKNSDLKKTDENNRTKFIYRPSNYPGPVALNATVKNEKV